MKSTVSEKGQVTLPKALRDQLGIRPGSRLDFQVTAEGRLIVTVMRAGASGLAGLLARPGEPPRTLADMDAAVSAAVQARSRRGR